MPRSLIPISLVSILLAACGAPLVPTLTPPAATDTPTPLTPTTGPVVLTTSVPSPAPAGIGVCDGMTDDTAALQRALNAGGMIILKAGVCILSATLTYGSDTALLGQGQEITTLRNAAGRNGTVMLAPKRAGVSHFSLMNLTLDAATTRGARDRFTVSADGTSFFLSDHVTYRQNQQMAIWTGSASGFGPTTHLTVQYSRVTEAVGSGFSFFGDFSDFLIDHNEIMNTQDDAIAVQDEGQNGQPQPTRITISNNNVHDCTIRNFLGSTPNGINDDGADTVTISGNTITNIGSDGIRVHSGSGNNTIATNASVTNNVVTNAGVLHSEHPDVPPFGIAVDGAKNVFGGGPNPNPTWTGGGTNRVINCAFPYTIENSTNVRGF